MLDRYPVTHWPHLRAQIGVRRAHTYAQLVKCFSTPIKQYGFAPSGKAETAGVSLATFASDRRVKAHVERVCGIGIDIDQGDATLDEVIEAYPFRGMVYSTRASTPDHPRWRVVLLLADLATVPDAEDATMAMQSRSPRPADECTRDASRYWFRPWAGAAHNIFAELAGEPIDAHDIATDWRERTAIASEQRAPAAPIRYADAYARKAVEGLCASLHNAAKGTRAKTINAVGFRLGRLVAGGLVPDDARQTVLDAALTLGARHDVERQLRNGFEVGAKSPAAKR